MEKWFFWILIAICFAGCGAKSKPLLLDGNLTVWSPTTFVYAGPEQSETRETFTDYRFDISFQHEDGHIVRVPGYFAASGDAAEDSTEIGTIWEAKFVPDMPGEWSYEFTFRNAPNVALNIQGSDQGLGLAAKGSGKFTVAGATLDPTATDFRKRGMLQDVKRRYLQFSGTKDYFLKTGAGSPENILGYVEFDGTYDVGGTYFPSLGHNQLHEFKPHLKDLEDDDPTWKSGKGASILGIANYYEKAGVNAQYLVTMNVEGDGQDVFPWTSHDDPYVFDVSKLAQWQRVLEHFNSRGVLIDMLLTETENESLFEALDGVKIGEDFADTRKLYYRELVARFGHLNGLVFNLGEENGVVGNSGQDPYRQPTSVSQRVAFAKYISDLDPYDHAIVSHNWPNAEESTYRSKIGVDFWSGVSLQAHHDYAKKVLEWTKLTFVSKKSDDRLKVSIGKRPWMVTVDEPLGWEFGARPGTETREYRKEIEGVLWPTLLAGGAGVDWYFGWQNNAPTSDLSNEDQRSRDGLWRASKKVADFIQETIDVSTLNANIVEGGTIVTTAKDHMGKDVKITLERRKPKLLDGEALGPWEYQVDALFFERAGSVQKLDTLNPEL